MPNINTNYKQLICCLLTVNYLKVNSHFTTETSTNSSNCKSVSWLTEHLPCFVSQHIKTSLPVTLVFT